MTTPLLSLLIPTVVGREAELNRLVDKLKFPKREWIGPLTEVKGEHDGFNYHMIDLEKIPVSILIACDNKEKTIGGKREWLYQQATGLYSFQIDDDDDIADNAIELILNAIRSNPEVPCITFKENCMMNGVYKSSNHSIKYDFWCDNFDGYDYCRSPFYKDVIRTDIAKSVPFPKIRYNEDEQWSYAIKDLLTSEIHIDSELYYYIYEPKDTHSERYGIN